MRKPALCLAAVLAACSDPAPAPEANVNPQLIEFQCNDYSLMPAEQVEAWAERSVAGGDGR